MNVRDDIQSDATAHCNIRILRYIHVGMWPRDRKSDRETNTKRDRCTAQISSMDIRSQMKETLDCVKINGNFNRNGN